MLRRIALAGLGAASLGTAALAHAAITPSTLGVLGDLQATVRAPASADALPMGNVPLLVAPRGCGSRCGILFGQHAPTATQLPAESQALPEPILVAPTCPTCRRGQGAPETLGTEHASEPTALPAPFLVALSCGKSGCMLTDMAASFRVEPASLRIAGGGCRGGCMSRLLAAEFDASPLAFGCKPYPAPLHASPYCGAGLRGPVEHATAEPSPLVVAGGDPTIVRDSRSGPRPRG
jgi:hypothetical protein